MHTAMRGLLMVLMTTTLVVVSCLLPKHASALNSVAPEPLSSEAAHQSIQVTAPYQNDDNTNSSITIYWVEQDTDWADASVQSVSVPFQASPYVYAIKSLSNYQEYQVKVVFSDDDGISNGLQEQIVEHITPYNRLIHNSYTTGSLKWSANGGWGIPNTKYGEFGCQTCHGRKTGNIKRIKKDLAVTDTVCPDQFPIEQDGGTVTFLNAKGGQSQFGDDTRIPAESSTNICESCHTRNKYHNYNSATNLGGTDHYNKENCTGCHQHNAGFKASCGGCHPEEPVMASHDEHFNSALLGYDFGCQTCHDTSVHRNALSEVRFDSESATVSSASYSEEGGDESSCFDETTDYCDTPTYGTCNNLYCHSNASPISGTNRYSQPSWGGAVMTCSSCHDPEGGTQAMSAPHGRHTDSAAYGYDCDKCHAGTVSGSDTIVDADLHINMSKDVAMSVTGTYNATTNECSNVYCHTDGRGGANTSPSCAAVVDACHYVDLVGDDGIKETNLGDQTTSVATIPDWSDTSGYGCSDCHKGRPGIEARNAQMDSNAHFRLANDHWIRQYDCYFCHNKTVDETFAIKFTDGTHVNEKPDVAFFDKWRIPVYNAPTYNATSMICYDIYCHSDGTTEDPEVRNLAWDDPEHLGCDGCHGHDENDDCTECHAGETPQWDTIDQWKQAMPMYENTGVGTARANSHLRHLETQFSCENCHVQTVVGACADCHDTETLTGTMTEFGHVNAFFHVDGEPSVHFGKRIYNATRDEYLVVEASGNYNPDTSCSNTECHTGDDPKWGDSRRENIICLTCHGTTGPDVNDYEEDNGIRGLINTTEWATAGHGRQAADGPYPKSGYNAANFPGNPCWYCHDSEVVHRDASNPLRLKFHPQFEARFEKECVFCHMEGQDWECRECHDDPESLSPQLYNVTTLEGFAVDHNGMHDPDPDDAIPPPDARSCMTSACHLMGNVGECLDCHDKPDDPTCVAPQMDEIPVMVGSPDPPYSISHTTFASQPDSCLNVGCHTADAHVHNTNSGFWTADEKNLVKKQYKMMGVCLQCHDDDSNDQCTQCHTGDQYRLGFDPGTGYITAESKVTGFHYGWKHEETKATMGGEHYPGGMFCWDCHDPHGDTNIYMIQDKVTTVNDGHSGIPIETAEVVFVDNRKGTDYAKTSAPYNGICNVCHMDASQHFSKDRGDNHQLGRPCTECHAHSFSDGHASGQACNECHSDRPIPRHTAFSQPRDCTKCHEGAMNQRMDIMRQFRAQSHHIQGVEIDNKHCYQCHWEATEDGLINTDYHEGYNYKTHETILNAKNDLVIWGDGFRPKEYDLYNTAVTFTATKIGTGEERAEVAKVTDHCIGCHSDQNNLTDVFGDCKTPNQYAWDRTSIGARYSQTGSVANWGKYGTKKVKKAYSAHGNAGDNHGGWNAATGEDEIIPNLRGDGVAINVQCYDCHSSHGSYTEGVTSSYVTFDGSNNGANLKETVAGKGGYLSGTYTAKAITTGLSPLNTGSAQCLDCHETADGAATGKPWGYNSTFGIEAPIHGYKDSSRYVLDSSAGAVGFLDRLGGFRRSNSSTHWSSHFNPSASAPGVVGQINGTCASCHDPHGISPTLGVDQKYAIPLLKGTWLTYSHLEDRPNTSTGAGSKSNRGGPSAQRHLVTSGVSEPVETFAGLCLRCHPQDTLVAGGAAWKTKDRIHQSVKGWGGNHSYACSKCHVPHVSAMPKLMFNNCLDATHRNNVASGGSPSRNSGSKGRGSFPVGGGEGFSTTLWNTPCHMSATGSWNDQEWNTVTPWP